VERRGVVRTVTVTPIDGRTAAQRSANAPAFGRVGIAPVIPVTKLSLPLAVWRAGFEMKDLTKETLGGLVNMFSGSSLRSYSHQLGETGPANPAKEGNRFLSPVGLVHLADTTAASGLSSVLMLLVLINIFVGIFNMLPLPPFDGGHVAVATYEAIRSRRSGSRHMIDTNRLLPVAWVMIAVLMLISVSALWLDVVHPFKLG